MANKLNKQPENTNVNKAVHCLPLNGVWGIFAAFTVASIVYSTYITIMVALNGNNQWVVIVPLIPQALFAAWIAIFKFSR